MGERVKVDWHAILRRPPWTRPGKRRRTMQRWPMRWEAYQHMIRTRSPRTRKRTMVPVTR